MKSLRVLIGIAVWACLLSSGAVAGAMDIIGTPTSTIMIFEDSQLVGDLDCTKVAPGTSCIEFAADNITLRLNGFTMTGTADPALGCTCRGGCCGTRAAICGLIPCGCGAPSSRSACRSLQPTSAFSPLAVRLRVVRAFRARFFLVGNGDW